MTDDKTITNELWTLVDRINVAVKKLESKMKSTPGCRAFKSSNGFTFDKIHGVWRVGYDGKPVADCQYEIKLLLASVAKKFYDDYAEEIRQVVSAKTQQARITVAELEDIVKDTE